MSIRHAIATSLFALGLVLNPAYFVGCSPDCDDSQADYGANELRELLQEINERHVWNFEGVDLSFTVELSLRKAESPDALGAGASIPTRRGCDTKAQAFSATAAACEAYVEMGMFIEGTLTVRTDDGEESVLFDEVTVTGQLQVSGHRFEGAPALVTLRNKDLYLRLEGKTSGEFHAAFLEADGPDGQRVDLAGQGED